MEHLEDSPAGSWLAITYSASMVYELFEVKELYFLSFFFFIFIYRVL